MVVAEEKQVNELRELVKAELAKNGPDIEKVAKHVRRRLDRRPELLEECLSAMIDAAIREQIYSVRHMDRSTLKRTLRGADVIAGGIGDAALAAILDTWRFRDKVLGDATGAELAEEANAEREQALGHQANSIFYASLADRLDGDEAVRDRLKDAEVAEIWRQAAGQATAE